MNKKLFLIFTIISLFLVTGCLSEKKNVENKIVENTNVNTTREPIRNISLEQLAKLRAAANKIKKSGLSIGTSNVPTSSNGIVEGVYLRTTSGGIVYYSYSTLMTMSKVQWEAFYDIFGWSGAYDLKQSTTYSCITVGDVAVPVKSYIKTGLYDEVLDGVTVGSISIKPNTIVFEQGKQGIFSQINNLIKTTAKRDTLYFTNNVNVTSKSILKGGTTSSALALLPNKVYFLDSVVSASVIWVSTGTALNTNISGKYDFIGKLSPVEGDYAHANIDDKVAYTSINVCEGVVNKPTFSTTSSTFINSGNLKINVESGTKVIYTTDGSDPVLYDESHHNGIEITTETTITINTSYYTTVKAIAHKNLWLPSEVASCKVALGRSVFILKGITEAYSKSVDYDFEMENTKVSQGEYFNLMGGAIQDREDYPAYNISWSEAVAYCNALSIRNGLKPAYSSTTIGAVMIDGYGNPTTSPSAVEGYRLPTSAEYEYAAIGGNGGLSNLYSGSSNIDEVAVYSTTRVAVSYSKTKNSLDLYDMSGNVYSWCYDNDINQTSNKIIRGGSWKTTAGACEVTAYSNSDPSQGKDDIGFCVVRTLSGKLDMPLLPTLANPIYDLGIINIEVLPNTKIIYTTDGSDPRNGGIEITTNTALYIENTTFIRAISRRDGWVDSDISEKNYIVLKKTTRQPYLSIPSGIYSTPQNVQISTPSSSDVVVYTMDSSEPLYDYKSGLALGTGRVVSMLTQNQSEIVNITTTTTIKLRLYPAQTVEYEGDVISVLYVIEEKTGTVSDPVFGILGPTYADQLISLSCNTGGAEIRYTLDNSEPTKASLKYSTPFTLTTTTVIKAKAYKQNWVDSQIVTNQFVIKPYIPVADIPTGTYSVSQNVILTTATMGAKITYTLDNSEPTFTSATYSTPINISTTTTLKAKAWIDASNSSDSMIVVYTFQ